MQNALYAGFNFSTFAYNKSLKENFKAYVHQDFC